MEWLTPMVAVYAAAIALPLYVLLYFLKLRRREQIISSTLLWKRAVQDLQVNAPFQRIRRNILFFLQLLMFLAMFLAIAQPVLSLVGGPSRRFVLLIDRSASMNSTDSELSRLEEAKKQAKTFIESMRDSSFFSLGESGDQAMVIAFDNRSKVMCNFTSNKRQLIEAIDLITPTDGKSFLAEAVTVARAFAQSVTTEANNRSAEEPGKLLLFSDGCIADIDKISVGKDELSFYSIGESDENVAITAMRARRSYENPEIVNIFVTLSNYGNEEVGTDVQLSLNGNVQAVKSVRIPPREAADVNKTGRSGKVSIDFSLSYSDRGILEVRHLYKDKLSTDDAAWSVIFPPRKLSVLLVTSGNAVLESALRACPIANLKVSTPAQFDEIAQTLIGSQQAYDVIIIDNYIPQNVVRGRYIIFGRPPAGIDVTVAEELKDQVVIDWRSRHPILHYVNLENLFAAKCNRLVLPRDSEILAEFNDCAAMAIVRRNGSVFLLVPFDVLETNWPFDMGLVMFCYNAVEFLSEEEGTGMMSQLQTGEPLIVDGFAPETSAKISGPTFSEKEVSASSSGSIIFDSVDRIGVYSLDVTGQLPKYFAVNLLDVKESDIEAVSEISLSGEVVKAQQGDVQRSNMPVWPILTGIILCIAILEWLIYNMKVRI